MTAPARPWLDLATSALDEVARFQPLLRAVQTVVELRRAPEPPAPAFEVLERFHERGDPGIVLRASSPEGAKLVESLSPGDRVEARAVFGDRWPGGALAPALEVLEQKLGRYLAGGPTTPADVTPPRRCSCPPGTFTTDYGIPAKDCPEHGDARPGQGRVAHV